MDKHKRDLVAELFRKTGIRIDSDDPAFLLVELNLLMLEGEAAKVSEGFETSSKRLNSEMIHNIDDFVSVANEALSKFIQRTNEIKETLEALKLKEEPKPETALVPETPKRETPGAAPTSWHWISATAFCVGTIAGIVLSMLLK